MISAARGNDLRILTWHVHGNYLYYLSHCPHQFFLPVKPDRSVPGYGGRLPGFPWPDNVHEVPAEDVAALGLDCILFQSRRNYLEDQYEILTPQQRRLPRLYLEHDTPQEHPTNTRHPVRNPEVTVVHVTHYNRLMWDNGDSPTRVVEHGVVVPEGTRYQGGTPRAVVAINNLAARGRRLGLDIFLHLRDRVPMDLFGIGSEELGGLGEASHADLPRMLSRYRVFFSPMRYTSLGLAICEAMTIGMPVVGLATTELVTVVQNGVSGYLETDVARLEQRLGELLQDPERARRMGEAARCTALQRFNINRFARDWDAVFREAVKPREGALAWNA